MYTLSIDAVCGKVTAKAVKAYIKGYFGNPKFGKSSNLTCLLIDILKDKPARVEEPKVMLTYETIIEALKVAEPTPEPP